MPIELLLKSERLGEPDHTLLVVCASWSSFRGIWIPGIKDLRLGGLDDLATLGDLDITTKNKDVVIEDLLKLRSWILSGPSQTSSHTPAQRDETTYRIARVVVLLDEFVDDRCRLANIS